MNLRIAAMAAFALIALPSTTEARGRCDGFHGCRCGVTQARFFGLPLSYNGHNLKQAIEWIRAFPHTSAQPGVVGYQHTHRSPTGHVFRVVSLTGANRAIVADERGQYERSLHGATFVQPMGNGTVAQMSAKPHVKHHRRFAGRHRHVAYYKAR